MKISLKRFWVALVVMLPLLASATPTHVLFTLSDFNASPTTNRTMTVQKLQPFPGNLVSYVSGTNGTITLSNATVGDYDCVILQKGTATAIGFQITVISTNLGVISAFGITSVRGTSTYPTSGRTAWTIEAAEARYSSTGTATNLSPWISDINAAGYSLTNAGTIQASNFSALGAVTFLSDLDVTGAINSGGDIYARRFFASETSSQAYTGHGGGLTNLQGFNISDGTINSNKLDAATLALIATAGNTNLQATNLSGTLISGVVTNSAGSRVAYLSDVGSSTTDGRFTSSAGTITAASNTLAATTIQGISGAFTTVSGAGSALTALNASQLASGTVPEARSAHLLTNIYIYQRLLLLQSGAAASTALSNSSGIIVIDSDDSGWAVPIRLGETGIVGANFTGRGSGLTNAFGTVIFPTNAGTPGEYLMLSPDGLTSQWSAAGGSGDVLAANNLAEYTATKALARRNIGADDASSFTNGTLGLARLPGSVITNGTTVPYTNTVRDVTPELVGTSSLLLRGITGGTAAAINIDNASSNTAFTGSVTMDSTLQVANVAGPTDSLYLRGKHNGTNAIIAVIDSLKSVAIVGWVDVDNNLTVHSNLYLSGTVLNASNATATFSTIIATSQNIDTAVITNVQFANLSNGFAYLDATGYIKRTNNGAALTNLGAANIAAGGTLPALNGAALTNAAGSATAFMSDVVAVTNQARMLVVNAPLTNSAGILAITSQQTNQAAILALTPVGSLLTNGLIGSGPFLAVSNNVVVMTNAPSGGGSTTNDTLYVAHIYSTNATSDFELVQGSPPSTANLYQRFHYTDASHGYIELGGEIGNASLWVNMDGITNAGYFEQNSWATFNAAATFNSDVNISGTFTNAGTYAPTLTLTASSSGVAGIRGDGTVFGTNTVTLTGIGFDTNSWTINTAVGLGTNYTFTSGAATGGISGVVTNVTAGDKEWSAQLIIKTTGDLVFTNPVAFYASDGLDSRTFTNGNLTTVLVHVVPNFSSNLIFSWSK